MSAAVAVSVFLLLDVVSSGTPHSGRTITLVGAWDGRETIVDLRPLDGSPAVVAPVHVALRSSFVVRTTSQAALLRLRPRGASPLTISIPAGNDDVRLPLPALATGGEVFGVLPRQAFLPEALELSGGALRRDLVPDRNGAFGASGLVAGDYTLVPRYRGGPRGQPTSLVVREGETTDLVPLPVVETGAVSLDVAADICTTGARLELRRTPAVARAGAFLLAQALRGPTCRFEIEGLEGGPYVATVTEAPEARGLLAHVPFEVTPGKRSALVIRPSVYVSGHVTYGDKRPAPMFQIEFESDGHTRPVVTNLDGDYAASLDAEGLYRIGVCGSPGLPPVSSSRRLRLGTQRVDLELGAAAVNVRVLGEDGAPALEPAQLALIAATGARIDGLWQPGAQAIARFIGLPYDEYRVTATTAAGLSSGSPGPIRVSADAPIAEVELVLGSHDGVLSVVDTATDQVLPDARAEAAAAPLEPRAPGEFALSGVALGEPVRVRAPGHVPVCRTLQQHDLPQMRVALEPATERLTIHVAAGVNWESAMVTGLAGSDCPVSLDAFDLQAGVARDEVTIVLSLSAGSGSLVVDGRDYPLVVPGGDVFVGRPQAGD